MVFAVAPASSETVTTFQAAISNLGAIAGDGVTTSTETGITGVGTFTLTEATGVSPTLAYDLRFFGADFTGLDGNPENDVTAIHIHDTTGARGTAGTPHVLNIFGFPSADDDDLVVEAPAGRLTGVWDDSDLTMPQLPHAANAIANSDTLTSMLAALRGGELFVMVHTTSPRALSGTPGISIGGQIVIPEPGALGLAFVGSVFITCTRNRRRLLSRRLR